MFEIGLRMGGDPSGFSQFEALRNELAKLVHTACPDVDWLKVEQLCLALFDKNGVELQSMAAFVLARSHRHGLDGMAQGVEWMAALDRQWPLLWPASASLRLDILSGLFAQLQPLLRGAVMSAISVPALIHLEAQLERLGELSSQPGQAPLVTLRALRGQIDSLVQRLAPRMTVADEPVQYPARRVEPPLLLPYVLLAPPPPVKGKKRPIALALLCLMVSGVLAGGFGWREWQRGQDAGVQRQLDSLLLFDAGSAEFKPGSDKALITALAGIKAQPGGLVVITGHTDASGDPGQNLQLSQSRAWAVREWMREMSDIPEHCLVAQGVGASRPVASDASEQGRAANRRVELQRLPNPSECL